MAKLRKASDSEKRNYADGTPKVHPLFGFIKVEGVLGGVKGHWDCAVEYLGEGRDNPNYEVMAPDGMRFEPDGCHSLLAFTQADAVSRLVGTHLEVCPDDCGCKEVPDGN